MQSALLFHLSYLVLLLCPHAFNLDFILGGHSPLGLGRTLLYAAGGRRLASGRGLGISRQLVRSRRLGGLPWLSRLVTRDSATKAAFGRAGAPL